MMYVRIVQEVKQSIKLYKNRNAQRMTMFHAEIQKAEEVLTPRLLIDILETIMQTETAPNDWKVGLIVK